MRPIADTDDYPFGECGYVVDGAYLRNGTKVQNLRIYKQRSDQMYDLLDPKTKTVYQKVLITGYSTDGAVLDYSKSNTELLNSIPKNTFFIRAYNDAKTKKGFVFKFLYNKIILSTGRALFDMYKPECEIPLPDISNVVINPIQVSDTEVSGTINVTGTLNTDGMLITLVLPDGTEYQTTVNDDGTFSFSPVSISSPGTATLTITSPYYNTTTISVQVVEDGEDSDYVTSIALPMSAFVQNGDSYRATITSATHQRGSDLVIQLQDSTGSIIDFSTVSVDDSGNINIDQTDASDINVILIGKTIKIEPKKFDLNWTQQGDVYVFEVQQTEHEFENISFTVYDNSNPPEVVVTVQSDIDSAWNLTLTSNEPFPGSVVIVGKE